MGSITAVWETLGLREALSAARGLVLLVALGIGALALVACDDPRAPDYRYRLTVEVETPEGVMTGSSVIEVEQTLGRAGGAPAGTQIYRRVRGEAVAVDLPDGRVLFALLRSESDNEWAETVVEQVPLKTLRETQGASPSAPEDDGPRFDWALQLEGRADVPRTYPAYAWFEERSAYPMLVTFGDLDDPTSVAKVDPDDLAATFGEGVALKRITVQLSDDPVTTGIEERLGWLPARWPGMLSGDRFQDFTKKGLASQISVGSFSSELSR